MIAPLLFLAAACASPQRPARPPAPTTPAEYFPLHLHAAWSYDSVDLDDPSRSGLVIMRVIRDDGTGGFNMDQGTRGAPAYYEVTAEGITRNGELFLAGPIARDTRWQAASGDTYVIANTGLTRTVPAGTFHDVIEVVRTSPDVERRTRTAYRETYYYAPSVGAIEAEVPVMAPGAQLRRFRLSLRGYTLDGQF